MQGPTDTTASYVSRLKPWLLLGPKWNKIISMSRLL